MAQKKRAASSKRSKTAAASKNSKKKKQQNYFVPHAVSSALVSIFLGIFLYTGKTAIINSFVTGSMCALFGMTAYIVPLSLAATTIFLLYTKNVKQYWIKFTLATLAICCLSAIIQLITASDLTSVANSVGNGGVVGAFIAVTLVSLVQRLAAYVILFIALVALIGALSGVSAVEAAVSYAGKACVWIKEAYIDIKENCRDRYEYEDDDFEEEIEDTAPEPRRKRRKGHGKADQNMDAANSFAAEAQETPAATELDYPDLSDGIQGIFGTHDDYGELPDTSALDLPVGDFYGSGLDMLDTILPQETPISEMTVESTVIEPIKMQKPMEEPVSVPSQTVSETQTAASNAAPNDSGRERVKKINEEEKTEFNKEFDSAISREVMPYAFPPLSLLNKPSAASKDQRSELRSTAEKLITILDSFGVKARLLQVTQGPAVTRYEIQPDTGTKLSKISGLSEDLALNLAVSTVLVAPVPGKAAVGIEIPNKKVSSVGLQELLASSEFKSAKSKLTFALGKDIGGNVVVGDIAKMPHLLIAGATGSGKSVCINTIIMSILYNASPQDVKLIMVDPKRVELGVYNGIPHLLVPVVTDPKKAAGALNWAVAEMMRRYDLFNETNTRKLESYNKLMKNTGGEEIPQLVIIIDELADLMMVAAKEVESYICRIAQLARAAGIHLIIATQRPSVDVVTGLIKANVPSRIALAVSQQVDSRTILDHGGAEKLLGRGDMLYHPAGARDARRVQGAYVDDAEIENVLSFIKMNSGEQHYSADLEEQIERLATGENGVTPDVEEDGDALLPDAINLAIELGSISTSMVQRRLGVGYSRAGRIIDQMEKRGIISGPNGSKPREVLVSSVPAVGGAADAGDTYGGEYEAVE